MNEVHHKKPNSTEAERRCIATRATQPKSGLVRFVVGPENVIVPDIMEKLPGRGIWVSAVRKDLEEAIKKNLFSRAAKTNVRIGDNLYEQVESQLAKRVIDMVSLGRKAGLAIAGLEKVKGWLLDDKAAILIQASDGSERGKSALRPPKGPKSHVNCLTSYELGMAFGRDTVIHAAMTRDKITDRVLYEATRLEGLRG